MTKHVISILTLLVVSLIAALTLLFETRESGHLTAFGYAVAVLTVLSFVLGVAAEVHTMREEAGKEVEQRTKELDAKQQMGRIEAETKASVRPLLPLALFYTLRHSPSPGALEREFAGIRGFKSMKSDLRLILNDLGLADKVQIGES